MGRKSSVSRLEPEARKHLELLIRQDRHTLDELLGAMRDKFPEAGVSRSSIYRFQVPFKEMLERMRDQQAMAGVLVQELGENPDDKAGALMVQAITTLTTQSALMEAGAEQVYDVTDAVGKGFACSEIEWHRVGHYWLPKSITHRPQSWFCLHRGYRQELRLRTETIEDGVLGEALRPFNWITHTHKAKSGYLERSSLFRQLVWTYLFKNYSVGDLAEFLEIYGIPLRVGKYPTSASEKEKATLLRALVGVGHNAAGIVPEGMLIEFHDAATGDPKAFELMMDWCEKNQSKVILGATLTSGADGKSSTNALGNIHNEVRKDLRDADVRQLNTTISRDLVYAMAAINGLAPDGPRRAPRFQLNAQESEDLTAYAEALPKLVSIGLQPTVKWAHEKLGIPIAQDGEPVLRIGGQETPATGRAALTAQLPTVLPASTPPVAMQPQLARSAAPAVSTWIDQIRALVVRARSLEDIRNGLEQLLPDMNLDQYAAAMAEALTAAHLAGRYDVLQEAGGLNG